jgi:hypothetical protein
MLRMGGKPMDLDYGFVALVVWLSMPLLALYVAARKGRGAVEGFLLGLLFGPLGVIVTGLLPTSPTVEASYEARVAMAEAEADLRRARQKQGVRRPGRDEDYPSLG